MAFRKIIKTGDPDDIRTGFAGAVWDIVKMSSLIGAFVAFFSGMVLKGKLLMLADAPAVFVGNKLAEKISMKLMRQIAATVFFILAVVAYLEA